MTFTFIKHKLNTNGLFGPTKENHFYKPVFYHNKTAKNNPHKIKWILKQDQQYEVFRVADESNWTCLKNGGLFSILANGEIIMGSSEERLSFFPIPQNNTDPYHGYPISSSEKEPSVELLDKWHKEKIIDDRIYIKILRRQL